jgi:hypothetical protein
MTTFERIKKEITSLQEEAIALRVTASSRKEDDRVKEAKATVVRSIKRIKKLREWLLITQEFSDERILRDYRAQVMKVAAIEERFDDWCFHNKDWLPQDNHLRWKSYKEYYETDYKRLNKLKSIAEYINNQEQ